jgi:hypothetical protein
VSGNIKIKMPSPKAQQYCVFFMSVKLTWRKKVMLRVSENRKPIKIFGPKRKEVTRS